MKLSKEWISGFVDGEGCFATDGTHATNGTDGAHGTHGTHGTLGKHPLHPFGLPRIKSKICQYGMSPHNHIQKNKKDTTILSLPPKVLHSTSYRFIVCLDKRSTSVLYGLKKSFKCGTVQKARGNMMAFQVSKITHLQTIIIPFFQKYRLKTFKRESFIFFVKSLENYVKKKQNFGVAVHHLIDKDTEKKRSSLGIPKDKNFDSIEKNMGDALGKHPLHPLHPLHPEGMYGMYGMYGMSPHKQKSLEKDTLLPLLQKYPFPYKCKDTDLSDGWFRGFIDSKGCFFVSLIKDQPIVQLIIGLQSKEKPLLIELQKFLKCGTVKTIKENTAILLIDRTTDLERYIFPKLQTKGGAVLLQSSKRIKYQKFRKIVRLLHSTHPIHPFGLLRIKSKICQSGMSVENKEKPLEGLEKIKRYKSSLDKQNQKHKDISYDLIKFLFLL